MQQIRDAILAGDTTGDEYAALEVPAAYRVTDLDAVSATLRERGLRLLYDEPRRGTSGSRVNFVHPKDAGGVLIELVQPAAVSR